MMPYTHIRKPYGDMLPSSDRRARRTVRRNLKRRDKFRAKRFEKKAEDAATQQESLELVEYERQYLELVYERAMREFHHGS